jgi:hypothetical protein
MCGLYKRIRFHIHLQRYQTLNRNLEIDQHEFVTYQNLFVRQRYINITKMKVKK